MRQCKLNNSPIIYYISGNDHNEWCLFLHAAFVNHKMYKSQIEYFEKKYNVLVVDIIGHGQSTNTKKGDSIDKMSAWLYDIMKAEKIEKVHIVGVSLGAILAQDFANRYPDSVNSLACFGGYDINNFDAKMQKENGASQILMMLKALVSIKWFAKANSIHFSASPSTYIRDPAATLTVAAAAPPFPFRTCTLPMFRDWAPSFISASVPAI